MFQNGTNHIEIKKEYKMSELKFYNNNPCEVIRKINDDFSEVAVYPQFDTDMSGVDWCTECLASNGGASSHHTCEQYQDVIDTIRSNESSIIVIVENRLLASAPVEFKAWKKLKSEIKEMSNEVSELFKHRSKIKSDSNRMIEYLTTLKEEIYQAEAEKDRLLHLIYSAKLEKGYFDVR